MTLPNITATGNLGGDPDLKFTPSGKAVVSLSVACNENKKDDAGNWETVSTTWLRVQFWDDEAQTVAEHLKKGDLVTVTGQLLVREYDKNDGTKGYSTEVKYPRISKALPKAVAQRTNASSAPANDPWAQQPTQSTQPAPAGWDTADKPPF